MELRENLEKKVVELDNNNSELKNNLTEFKLECEKIVKDNLRADIKNKKIISSGFYYYLPLLCF